MNNSIISDDLSFSSSSSSIPFFEENDLPKPKSPSITVQLAAPGMKNMKCYGRKKFIVPSEKSFIRNFFDGNESSELLAKGLQDEHGAKCHENKENAYNFFESPVLFNEDLSSMQKKKNWRSIAQRQHQNLEDESGICSDNKENINNTYDSIVLFSGDLPTSKKDPPIKKEKAFDVKNVAKPKQGAKNRYGRRNNYVRKKVKGFQHLSTKYCKSQQPCWDEFEKHEFTIDRPGKTNNSERLFKNLKKSSQILPLPSITNNIKYGKADQAATSSDETQKFPKSISNVKTRSYFPPKETLESSGELFAEIGKHKRSIKKKKEGLRKKHTDKLSHNTVLELEDKIKQCMQNIDFSEISNKNIDCNCKSSNYVEKVGNASAILSSDSVLPEQAVISSQNTKTLPSQIIPESKNFCGAVNEVSKCFRNLNSISLLEFHNVRSTSEFPESLKQCYPQQRFSQFVDNISAEVNSHSDNDNILSGKSDGLFNDKNLILNMPKKPALDNSHQRTGSNKSQDILVERTTITDNSKELCTLTTENLTDKPVCINEDDLHCINSKLVEEKKAKISMSSKPQTFNKNSGISLNNNVEGKIVKKSIITGSNPSPISFNTSNINQTIKSFWLKLKGKNVTSTPVTSRSKNLDFFNADIIALSDDEEISGLKEHSKHHSSLCQKATESNLKFVKTNQPRISFINCLNEPATVEIQQSLQHGISPNLHKSRKSLTAPSKSNIHSVSQKKNSSLLNISSIDASHQGVKSGDFKKAELLELCDQDSVTPFADIYDWKDFKVEKIGEGTYGEVFKLSKGKTSSVLKVIAITEDPNVKGVQDLSTAYSEVKISKCLSQLRCNQINQCKNFVKTIRSSVVCGSYPIELMEAWDNFSVNRSTYNERPDIYSEDQLFVILELEYGGKDMEHFILRHAHEAEILLKQIAVSLAVAEEEFSFEHRDLHVGNILVKRNRSKTVSYKLRGKDISFPSLGLQVIIIDFTLSLLSENNYIYFNNLADDESLFDQTGDFQYAVYKSMRKHLENKWEENSLYSNVLWLKYLCQKMKDYKYTRPAVATHKRGLKAIDNFNVELMNCSCALECLQKCGISKTDFKRSISGTPRNSILVSRNSIRKSKLSICK